jgi:molybdopterin-guanine dinucleotide biosynthesis protein A
MAMTLALRGFDQERSFRAACINHLVILGGGKGTRLAGITSPMQKILMPIGGKPVLQHHLELARASGLRSVLVQTGAAGGDGRFTATPDHVAPDLGIAAKTILAATSAVRS